MRYVILLIGGLLLGMSLQAQTSKPDTIRAHFGKVTIDGHLDEPAWEDAHKISNFTQRELNEGDRPTETTKVAVVYDGQKLYIGVWCYDSEPDKIKAKELRRDFGWGRDDNFKLVLDTYNDDRNSFFFVTNPNGARADAQSFNNGGRGNFNRSWDGVWNAAARITDWGWAAEIVIPFSTLKFRTNIEKQIWGINFERNIQRKREQVLWQGWSRNYELTTVSQAGTLVGLDKLEDKDFIEIKPYGLAGGEFADDNQSRFNGGGEINYLITPALKAKLTINTDFAQVESDLEQINLTRFPLFFPEKREFFLEGEDYFDMGFGGNRITPFYSRRIGLTKDRQEVPIIAAGRLLGKTNNTTFGAMSLQTAQKDSLPTTNYSIFSWRQDILKQSTVGVMTVNKYADGRFHSTTGVNAKYSTAEFLNDKNLQLGGAYIQTYNSDASFDHKAAAYRVQAVYPNDKMFFVGSHQSSPAPFDPEVGLMRRRNFKEWFGMVEIRPRPKGFLDWIQQFTFSPGIVTYDYFHDDGQLQTFSYEVKPLGLVTRSGESLNFTVSRTGEGLKEAFNLTEDITIDKGEYWQTRYTIDAATFNSRDISGSVRLEWGEFFKGNSIESQYALSVRASKYLNIAASYEKNWVSLPQGYFETNLISTHFNYAITPNLFGTLFTQWNNQDDKIILNYRLQWIPVLGADFFLIVNQRYDTGEQELNVEKTTVIGKLVWRFVL